MGGDSRRNEIIVFKLHVKCFKARMLETSSAWLCHGGVKVTWVQQWSAGASVAEPDAHLGSLLQMTDESHAIYRLLATIRILVFLIFLSKEKQIRFFLFFYWLE